MPSRVMHALSVAIAVAVLAAACTSSPTTSNVGPTQTPTIDNFVGTWTSGVGGSVVPGQCSKLNYTITKVNDTSATVVYDLTCSGIGATGTGSGVLQGAILQWSASGTVSGGGLPPCPFQFTDGNNTATRQGTDAILVNYSGTICGASVSGSQVLHKQ